MTSQDAYITFLNLANKLNSDDSINIDIGRFILLYNKNAKVWLSQKIKTDKSSDDIDNLQNLLEKNVEVPISSTSDYYKSFKLPDNWYQHVSAYALCDRDSCKNRVVNTNQVKNEEERLILFDENWRPDFDFEWLPITFGSGTILAYYRDFTINRLYIDYYRYPVDIDIAGYIKPDNVTPSTNINPDLDDIYVNQIIDLVVADVSRIYQNNEKVQLDINRINQEN